MSKDVCKVSVSTGWMANKLYPAGEVPRLKPRTRLYRNFYEEFERILTRTPNAKSVFVGSWQIILSDLA